MRKTRSVRGAAENLDAAEIRANASRPMHRCRAFNPLLNQPILQSVHATFIDAANEASRFAPHHEKHVNAFPKYEACLGRWREVGRDAVPAPSASRRLGHTYSMHFTCKFRMSSHSSSHSRRNLSFLRCSQTRLRDTDTHTIITTQRHMIRPPKP